MLHWLNRMLQFSAWILTKGECFYGYYLESFNQSSLVMSVRTRFRNVHCIGKVSSGAIEISWFYLLYVLFYQSSQFKNRSQMKSLCIKSEGFFVNFTVRQFRICFKLPFASSIDMPLDFNALSYSIAYRLVSWSFYWLSGGNVELGICWFALKP